MMSVRVYSAALPYLEFRLVVIFDESSRTFVWILELITQKIALLEHGSPDSPIESIVGCSESLKIGAFGDSRLMELLSSYLAQIRNESSNPAKIGFNL